MYPIAIVGNDWTAAVLKLACTRSGFTDITHVPHPDWVQKPSVSKADPAAVPATTLGANTTRILHALGLAKALDAVAQVPDREQIRLAKSGYLLAELPLGRFYEQRYASPLVNVESADLDALSALVSASSTHGCEAPSLAELARTHAVVLVTQDSDRPYLDAAGYQFFHAALPGTGPMNRCNITWLARQEVAWQYSTPSQTHFVFACRSEPDPSAWHPALAAPLEAAQPLRLPARDRVRDHWVQGNTAFLGEACYSGSPFFRESNCSGFEDAWVLARMLDNYEEDVQDGLTEYEKFRQPRARKIVDETANRTAMLTEPALGKRITRNVGLAFGTRFLPEIAMHRRDWFHSYDCVKGFR